MSADKIKNSTSTRTRAVKRFSRDMIRRYLDSTDLTYLRDERDDFRVDFAHDDELDGAISFWLMAVGENDEVYGIEARSTRRFPREIWDWCLFVVNEWNKRMRYPKAYLYVGDDTARTGEIRLEQYFDLEQGVHQALVDSMTATTMGAAMRFWSWLNEQAAHQVLVSRSDTRLDG